MNEQLKERLIREAGFHIRPSIENTVPGIDWHSANWGYDQCMDRLIELVAKECADICNKIYFDRYPDAEDFERSEEGDAIKEHFGVKE